MVKLLRRPAIILHAVIPSPSGTARSTTNRNMGQVPGVGSTLRHYLLSRLPDISCSTCEKEMGRVLGVRRFEQYESQQRDSFFRDRHKV
jgi:hypothetical protein